MSDKHLYGPVPSRRLGLSLGVDIIPLKVCTLDCVYCQLGRNSQKTLERKEYIPVGALLEELKKRIAQGLEADYITIAGSGEPTLHSSLGKLIDGIKALTSIPVAVLTNGTLLSDSSVRAGCCKADLLLPSLDAGDEETFQKINRPHIDLNLEKLVDGLCALRREFAGQIWLEVFFIEGINTDNEQIDKIASLIKRINPDKVQLNTAVRPATEPGIGAATPFKLAEIAARLGGGAEVIADFAHTRHAKPIENVQENILAMLKRRPCSLDDICSSLALTPNEAIKHISLLQQNNTIESEQKNDVVFFYVK